MKRAVDYLWETSYPIIPKLLCIGFQLRLTAATPVGAFTRILVFTGLLPLCIKSFVIAI